jgi:hypothetical protein
MQTAKFLLVMPSGATGNWNFGAYSLTEMFDLAGLRAAVYANVNAPAPAVEFDSMLGGYTIEWDHVFESHFDGMQIGGLEPDGTPIIPVQTSTTGNPMVDANNVEVLPTVTCLRRNEWSE